MNKAIALASGLLLLSTGAANAAGIGAQIGVGSQNWDNSTTFPGDERSIANHSFVLDTSVSENTLVSYRLTLGNERNFYKDSYVEYEGFMMTHSLGFRLMANDNVKMTLGPTLKLVRYDKFTEDFSSVELEYEGEVEGTGVGLEFVTNIQLSRNFALSISAGHRSMDYEGHYGSNASRVNIDSSAEEQYVNFGTIFVFGER